MESDCAIETVDHPTDKAYSNRIGEKRAVVSDKTPGIIYRDFAFKASGRSDVGLKRDHNEDCIEIVDQIPLFAVADGMGGHAAGEVASHTALQIIREFIENATDQPDLTWPFGSQEDLQVGENILVNAILLANQKLCTLAEENTEYSGMGTTLAVLYPQEDTIHIGHVGDSRIYLFSQGQLELLTNDHSWVNEQLQRQLITEEEARNHRWRNVITRALGNRSDLDVDLCRAEPNAGDIFLLCTDGLTNMISDERMAEMLTWHGTNLDSACEAFVAEANRAGGLDNISAILVQVLSAS